MKVGEPFSIASRIEQAFQSASTSTGASFEYLVKTAKRESNFDEDAKARTSSASGLFQFIESTWLETMKESGHKHGLGTYADQIERTSGGRYRVRDPQMRQEILAMRDNAEIASTMAGELTQKNAAYLSDKLGRQPSEGELYIAHFLGAGGASKLISLAESNPELAADKVFSRQARANKPIFYDRGGARSVSEVYANLISKHGGTAPALPGATRFAAVPASKPGAETAVAAATQGGEQTLAMGDPTSRVLSAWSATADVSSPFHALFRNGVEARKASFDSRFVTAFAAQEAGQEEALLRAAARRESVVDASGTDAYSERRSRILTGVAELRPAEGGGAREETRAAVPVPERAEIRTASLVRGQPMDLTGFLSYRPAVEQKDLLPPV
ncbi:MAG: lytic transglycosylase [Stappia sp.]|uniref:lytic transglycosylase domain-containing protein n=1 Tax=Stappia sp. TaxID=1870903 RepID=UPI000C665581|nr:lytic transglycosylase domain-containing protein [Stappia sp.]MAA99695.1 lytic transglycosylase [Stappia sp.]MBM22442.1 lytic transglycosylase [Stappia sp.]